MFILLFSCVTVVTTTFITIMTIARSISTQQQHETDSKKTAGNAIAILKVRGHLDVALAQAVEVSANAHGAPCDVRPEL